jgi:hypothetical protein
MCSEGFLFYFQGSGGGDVFARGRLAIRNRPQALAMGALWPYLWRLLQMALITFRDLNLPVT